MRMGARLGYFLVKKNPLEDDSLSKEF